MSVVYWKNMTPSWRLGAHADKQALLAQSLALEAEKWPINWLPNELLILIFIMVSDLDFDDDIFYHRPPVVLSHVCTKWRKVCLMTSCLWSRISHGSVQFSHAALSTFIERSNNNPLDLVFHSPRNSAPYDLAELRPHIPRLQSIDVFIAVIHSQWWS